MATSYRNERREPVQVDADVVVKVLGCSTSTRVPRPPACRTGQAGRTATAPGCWHPTVAVRLTGRPLPFPGAVALVDEDGTRIDVRDELPGDLSPGWYRLQHARRSADHVGGGTAEGAAAPADVGLDAAAVRAAIGRSWGIGDLGDLREFVDWTAREHGAGAVLLNPLHAPGPTHPVQPSPYTPSSRRFANPLALRIEDIDAYRRADPDTRAEVDALRVSASTPTASTTTWCGRRNAMRWNCFGEPRDGPDPFDDADGRRTGLRDWATYCALAERHGGRWSRWPEALRDVAGPAVAAARRELAPRWHSTPGCSSSAPSS